MDYVEDVLFYVWCVRVIVRVCDVFVDVEDVYELFEFKWMFGLVCLSNDFCGLFWVVDVFVDWGIVLIVEL